MSLHLKFRHWFRFLLVLIGWVLVFPSVSVGAPKANKPSVKKGDKIEVNWQFDWLPAEVVSIEPTGWIKAKFKDKNGREMDWPFPPDNTRRPAKAAVAAEAADENPFETDDPKESRTWTDSSGKHKIEATFTEIKDGKVHLKKTDGTVAKIPLDKLSPSDQRLARKFSGEAVGDETTPDTESDSHDPDGYRWMTVEADWSAIGAVTLDENTASVPPDAISVDPDGKTKKIMLQQRAWGGDHFFETVQRLFFHPSTTSAMLTHVLAPPGKEKAVRIERCDLTAGKSLGSVEIKTGGTPYDVSPNGLRLVCVNEWPEKHKFVEIWKLDGKAVVQEVSFLPTDTASPHAANLNTNDAGFVDDGHLWTQDSMGKFVVWEIAGAKAIYFLSGQAASHPSFSANRKFVAMNLTGGSYVLDALTGTTVSKLDGTPIPGANGRFSEDGKRYAAVKNSQVRVWDLETAKVVHEVFFPRQLSGQTVDFVSSGLVLVDGQYLIDLPKRMVLWEYQINADNHRGNKMVRGFANSLWAQVSAPDRSSKGLFPLKLPTDEAKKAAMNLDAAALLVVKPGARMDLRVQCQNPQETQKIGTELHNRLKAMNMDITTDTQLWLEATVTPGKTKTVAYQTIGVGRGSESVTVTEQHCRLALMEGGKTLWEAKAIIDNAPHFIHNRENQSLQETVSKGNESSVEAFFSGTTIPPYLMRHPEYVVQGATAITAQGNSPAKPTWQQQAEKPPEQPQPGQPQPGRGPVGSPGFPGFPGRPPFGR